MFRQEEKNETFYSELKDPKYQFAVLVNQNTASAAEVLAGAMQDSKIGYLIGDTTYTEILGSDPEGRQIMIPQYVEEGLVYNDYAGHVLEITIV